MAKVGDKFIIEIGGISKEYAAIDKGASRIRELYRIKGFNSLVFDENGLKKLEKPDNYCNERCGSSAFYSSKLTYNEGYYTGLNDAWEAARKIMCDKDVNAHFNTIFKQMAWDDKANIFDKYTAAEAIEKIKAYEKEKKAEQVFQIGKCYQHSDGKKMRIISEINTHFYGKCLLAETDKGDYVPVGKASEHAINWRECEDFAKEQKKARHSRKNMDILS